MGEPERRLDLAFARAVAARHDALRVYPRPPANKTLEVSWGGGALPSGPFAVYVHDPHGLAPTVALEFDGAHGDPEAEAATVVRWLRALGIRCVLCSSGRPQHRHVFATFRPPLTPQVVGDLVGVLRDAAPSLDPGVMFNTRTGAIRPPLAPHRLGGASQLLDPADGQQALAALREPNSAGTVTELAQTPTGRRSHATLRGGLAILQRPPSDTAERLLREGDTAGRYPSRSEAEAALVLGLINAGWSDEVIQKAADDPRNGGFGKYREKLAASQDEALRYLRATITWAIATASAHPPAGAAVADELQALAAAALGWHPGGRTAAVDRVVLLAHVRAALAARSRTHGLSVRQCAEWAGISDNRTVSRARRRLAERGWLTAPAGGTSGTAHRFTLPPSWPRGGEKSLQSFPRGREGMVSRLLTPDLFHSGVLGAGSAEVYALLLDSGREWAVTELARALRHDRKTIRAHLKVLSDVRLALRTQVGWLASARAPEDALAEFPPEARDAADRQRRRHAAERERWLASEAARAPVHGNAPTTGGEDHEEQHMRRWG